MGFPLLSIAAFSVRLALSHRVATEVTLDVEHTDVDALTIDLEDTDFDALAEFQELAACPKTATRYQFQVMVKAQGADVIKEIKYLPMEAAGSQIIFPTDIAGSYKVDTSAVQKGAGIRYRLSKNPADNDPLGAAVEDGDTISATQVGDWLKVEVGKDTYVARPLTALQLNNDAGTLSAYPGEKWVAELDDPMLRRKASLQWTRMPSAVSTAVDVDLASDIESITRVWHRPDSMKKIKAHDFDPEPASLEIRYKNGNLDTFYGGMYYEPELMHVSVLHHGFVQGRGIFENFKKSQTFNSQSYDDFGVEVRKSCLGWKWCQGFQYNPQARPIVVYYFEDAGLTPVDETSQERSLDDGTMLSDWVSYRYIGQSSEGALLNVNLTRTKYQAWVLTKKNQIMKKKAGIELSVAAHYVDRANIHDSLLSNGTIAVATQKATGLSTEQTKLSREKMVKTWSYRAENMIASEQLFEALKCVSVLEPCGKDMLLPVGSECPK